jgi:uncharacterized protein with HEPN domain
VTSKKYRDCDYLEHIASRIARIERATSKVDLAGFLGNEDLQAAVERYIEVIGEAAGKLSQDTRQLAPEVPWSQVIGARNVITHGYAEIEPDRIWGIIKEHLPSLRDAVDRLQQRMRGKCLDDPHQQAQPGKDLHRPPEPRR